MCVRAGGLVGGREGGWEGRIHRKEGGGRGVAGKLRQFDVYDTVRVGEAWETRKYDQEGHVKL